MKKINDGLSRLKMTHIALDNYADIFSDFDISPYSKRLLSFDFIKELRRRSAETKTGELEVTFTLPKTMRSIKTETLIRKRLKYHFRIHLKKVEVKINDSRKKGILKIMVGLATSVLILTLASSTETPLTTMMSVLAWYFMWAGFTNIFESSDKFSSERDFFKRFLNAKYEFMDEGELLSAICEPSTQDSKK